MRERRRCFLWTDGRQVDSGMILHIQQYEHTYYYIFWEMLVSDGVLVRARKQRTRVL